MICRVVPTKERTELSEAVEFAFENIAVCIAFNQSAIDDEVAARVDTIKLLIGAKKIHGKAFDIPLAHNLAGFNVF